MLRLSEMIELACLLEATARKPGNVHPGASFVDLHYDDFVQGATAIAPVLARAPRQSLGQTVLEAVQATQQQVASNLNLGIVLLMAPLATVPLEQDLFAELPAVLARSTQQDAADVYRAIRLAHPGGLGKVDDQDVASTPTQTLVEVMQLAADRDLIAAQYVTSFELVKSLAERLSRRMNDTTRTTEFPVLHPNETPWPQWEWSIVATFLELLAEQPDSLVARKVGLSVAREAQSRAATVLAAEWPWQPSGWEAFRQCDAWLRGDGHRRNPGTSADLIAAALFVVQRQEKLNWPSKHELLQHAASV